MKYEIKLDDNQLETIIKDLNYMIGSIDRIGSGFDGIEETSLALLLFFKENNSINKLSHVRHLLYEAMEKQLNKDENEDAMERELEIVWKPPYDASREELLTMIKNIE